MREIVKLIHIRIPKGGLSGVKARRPSRGWVPGDGMTPSRAAECPNAYPGEHLSVFISQIFIALKLASHTLKNSGRKQNALPLSYLLKLTE